MSDPWKADQPIKEDNIINESERDSATPTNDKYKLVKLEDDGRFSKFFLRGRVIRTYDLADSPFTWDKPTRPDFVGATFELWGGGASGGSRSGNFVSGGGGGAYEVYDIDADNLPASLDGVVGAGGVGVSGSSNGNDGDDSSLGLMRAKGGGAGKSDEGAVLGGDGGQNPFGYEIFGIYGQGKDNDTSSGGGQKSGGGGYSSGDTPRQGGGDSIYGGAGGAGKASDVAVRPGGKSLKGGDGGDSNNGGTNGSPGQVPGGGGGAAFDATSGGGGAGRIVITEYYI